MDHILEGVLASGHPDIMKRQLIEKISEKGKDQHASNDVRSVLQLAMNWVLQGTSELQVSSGFKLFRTWAQHHVSALENLLTRDLLVNLISKPSRNHANLPLLLTDALNILQDQGDTNKVFLQHLKILSAKAPVFLQESPNIAAVKNYLQMLLHFKDSLPKGDLAERLAIPLMRFLASNHIPADEKLVYRFIMDVTSLTDILQQVWKESSLALLLSCLQELFNIISAVEGPEPSVALGALVRLIPTEVVKSAVTAVVMNVKILDAAVNAALCRMIDWLVWPTCRKIDEWIICFLTELAAAKKFSILINITENKVEQVLDKLQYAPVREASFNILTHMLLSFQHSPQPFHKILPTVPVILAALQKEGTAESKQWHTKLAELLYCLMYLHNGFPDLYDPVLDLIKEEPSPSSEDIQRTLSHKKWTTQRGRGSHMRKSVKEKSETGKTGLLNLGNTCFMNGVLQTLFMCDDYRRDLMQRRPLPGEVMLRELQHVFASLLLSQRGAIAPRSFHEKCLPSWFREFQQQDCSEFLTHMLVHMDEQELEAKKMKQSTSRAESSAKEAKPSAENEYENQSETLGADCAPKSETGAASTATSSPSSVDSDEIERDRTLVKEWFGGKMSLTSRCLTCQHESHSEQDFTNIYLGFPRERTDSLPSPLSAKALVGGGSHAPQTQFTKPEECPASSSQKMPPANPPSDNTPSESIHLRELINHYLSPEQMTGDNKYSCERCGKHQDGERFINIVESPEYLIFIFSRFSYDSTRHVHSKILKDVRCPRTLALPVQGETSDSKSPTDSSSAAKRRKQLLDDLKPKLSDKVLSSADNLTLYGLCSVIVHAGVSSDSGHYFCFSRHSHVVNVEEVISQLDRKQSSRSCSMEVGAPTSYAGMGMEVDQEEEEDMDIDFLPDQWFQFNDHRVSYATLESVRSLSKRYSENTPYVVVYKKLRLDSQTDQQLTQEPPVRRELHEAVRNEDRLFLQFLEAEERENRQRSSPTYSTNTFTHWRDSDSDQGPPGSWGGGGGLDTSGSRFVY